MACTLSKSGLGNCLRIDYLAGLPSYSGAPTPSIQVSQFHRSFREEMWSLSSSISNESNSDRKMGIFLSCHYSGRAEENLHPVQAYQKILKGNADGMAYSCVYYHHLSFPCSSSSSCVSYLSFYFHDRHGVTPLPQSS